VQTTFYSRFRDANPDIRIGQTSFIKLKPLFVKTLQDRDVCCCKHHTELIMLKDAFNQMRLLRHVHTNYECSCIVCCLEFDHDEEEVQFNVCSAHALVYKAITDLWEACLCPK
jgi:hypothetical protein